jgi:NAD(P)-dependent dehydrogenase (short-subunit alcohol dehydrogenase family)
VALVTGASRGIGLAVAGLLASRGCSVVTTARQASATARDQKFEFVACDVGDPPAVDKLLSHVRRKFRRLDVLVNNAGLSHSLAHADRLPPSVWHEVIATNLNGVFLVTRAALPLMRRGAIIINNLSIAATRGFAGQSAYCASKHGALGFTRALREEVRGRGIRVVALLPGATDTQIWNQFWPDAPRKSMLRPHTVAQAVLDIVLLPPQAMVEEITLMPTAGAL